MSENCMKLHVLGFGMALGTMWALAMLFLGLAATIWGWGAPFLELMASMYIGYSATYFGSLIGALWGFVDAFIGGVILAFLYNYFTFYCCCKGSCKKDD